MPNDHPGTVARMLYAKTIRATVAEATELRAELERGTARLTTALIVVAALAAFAVVVAVSGQRSHPND